MMIIFFYKALRLPKHVLILFRSKLNDIQRMVIVANRNQNEEHLMEAGQEAIQHAMLENRNGTTVQDIIKREKVKAVFSVEGR